MFVKVKCDVLTDPLDGSRALTKHAQSSVHYFPVESPSSTIISKCNVFTASGQNVCGNLYEQRTWMKLKQTEMAQKIITGRYTYSSGPSCKHLSLLQKDFFSVQVLVDNDDSVRTHHQRVRFAISLLQFFEKYMRRVWASQTQKTANEGQRWEVGRLLRFICRLEFPLTCKESQDCNCEHTQTQKTDHTYVNRALHRLVVQRRLCIPA